MQQQTGGDDHVNEQQALSGPSWLRSQTEDFIVALLFLHLLFQDTTLVCVLTEIATAHHPCLCFRWWWKVGTGWSGVTCRSWIRSPGMTGWISTAWLRLSSNRSSNRWMRVWAIFLLVLVWFLMFMQRWWETDSPVSVFRKFSLAG